MPWTIALAASLPGTPLRINERTQIVKAVSCDQAGGHKFPQSSFNLRFQLACSAYDIGKERGSPSMEELEDFTSARAKHAHFLFRVTVRRLHAGQRHPFSFIADEEGDGSNACGNNPASAPRRIFQHRWMRRKAAPADGAGKTELVKNLWIVTANPARQNVALPCACRNFKALQLAQHLHRAVLSPRLRPRRNMLPAQQPAHERGGSDWFNLLAQRAQCEPMNSRH